MNFAFPSLLEKNFLNKSLFKVLQDTQGIRSAEIKASPPEVVVHSHIFSFVVQPTVMGGGLWLGPNVSDDVTPSNSDDDEPIPWDEPVEILIWSIHAATHSYDISVSLGGVTKRISKTNIGSLRIAHVPVPGCAGKKRIVLDTRQYTRAIHDCKTTVFCCQNATMKTWV